MRVCVIGAGPAGLAAAYCLQSFGVEVVVFEAGSRVGGMAGSFDLWGHRVDFGPHRFWSSDERVNALWREVLAGRYRTVNRRTRIYYRQRFFDYPLKLGNVLRNLSLSDLIGSLAAYAKEFIAPEHHADQRTTFEAWVVHHFGRRLYEIFFKSYSEKLWGIPCDQLDADFAAQRIKRFSLPQAILTAFGSGRKSHKTLVDVFLYPTEGSGAVYLRMADAIIRRGGTVHLSCPVERAIVTDGRVTGVALRDGNVLGFDHVVSTMPLSILVKGLEGTPAAILDLAGRLRFRNTILVYLRVATTNLFPDQWIYIHAGEVAVGRVTNFRNWVPELYGNLNSTVLALEYWCNDADVIWSERDEALIRLAEQEMRMIGLIGSEKVAAGHVVRIPRCYPVYSRGYRDNLAPVIEYLKSFNNLWPIGRYGAFKYNNQDHSILMGLLVAENIADGKSHDLWAVNTDYDSYQEQADKMQ